MSERLAVAVQIDERQAFCRLLWGEEYSERIKPYRDLVRRMKDAAGGELKAAMLISKKVQAAKPGEDLTLLVAALFSAAMDEITGVAA